MTAIFNRQLSSTLLAGALAIAGTFVSFTATTTPAHAASAGNTAKLATALEAPVKKVVNGVLWNCEGSECSGAADGGSPLNSCAKVAKTFGALSSFATPKGELSADKLARCNAAA